MARVLVVAYFFSDLLAIIPLAWVLAVPLGFGPQGVCIAIAVAFSTFAVSSAIVFRRGKWKTKRA